jgi:hypothetical protein
MARIIDLDKVKAGVSKDGGDVAIPGEPVTPGTDSACGTDWVCEGPDDLCVIDHACKYGPDAGCTVDYACGIGGHDEGACILGDFAC